MPNGDEKNWTRLCAAVEGFRSKYGTWPSQVRLTEGALSEIRDHVLDADEFELVSGKIKLLCEPSATMIAETEGIGSYNYGTEGFPEIKDEQMAEEWLLHSAELSKELSPLDKFKLDPDNVHKQQGNPKVICNALYKNKDNVNVLLTANQAIELAQYILQKAHIILDHGLTDAVVHIWNQGPDNERFYLGLHKARKGPRRKKNSL